MLDNLEEYDMEGAPFTHEEWFRLQRRVRWLGIGFLLAMAVAIGAVWLALPRTDPLRTRGLVIVDDDGRTRILMGASATSPADVPNAAGAITYFDPQGHRRLAIGQTPALVKNGKVVPRISSEASYSLTIYDAVGNERGGAGYVAGARRAVIALDRAPPAADAVGLLVDDSSGFAGFVANYEHDSGSFAVQLGTQGDRAALDLFDTKGRQKAH
ncbi:hypothetical protein ACFWZ1_10450 [Frateuria sp. GZRe14]|uniref:hypothetical protein n=1 Tax=Frateuria sp. GZRe14 TaxID=3351534 RepID=UPI003EDBE962